MTDVADKSDHQPAPNVVEAWQMRIQQWLENPDIVSIVCVKHEEETHWSARTCNVLQARPDTIVDSRPDFAGDIDCKVESYNQAHEDAIEMGYPSITEALEHLSELKARPDVVEAVRNVVAHIERYEGDERYVIAQWQLDELDRIAALRSRDDTLEEAAEVRDNAISKGLSHEDVVHNLGCWLFDHIRDIKGKAKP